MTQNNTNILTIAQTGHRKAQMKLYDLYFKAVFNSCYRILRNKEDAEDIAQDTFLQVFDKNITFSENVDLEAFLRKMGINKSIDYLRKQKKIQLFETINHEEVDEVDIEDYKIDIKKLYDSILKLPQQYRMVLNLYLIEGYEHSEIAEILNITSSTSRSQLTRAKQKLITIISDKTS